MAKKKNKGLIPGVIMLALGIFMVYWAQAHSPMADIFSKAENVLLNDSFVMSEPWFYVCLIGGLVIAIMGIIKTYKSF